MTTHTDNKKFRFLSLFVLLLLIVIGILSYKLYESGKQFHENINQENREGSKKSKPEDLARYSAPASRKSNYLLNSQVNHSSWDPYVEIERLQEYMNQLVAVTMDRFYDRRFEDLQRFNFNLNGEVEEDNRYYVLNIAIPNVQPESIDVTATEKQLQIKGINQESVEEKDSQGNIIHSEVKSTSFLRTINLPEKVDPTSLEKTIENGMLQIKLKKLNSKS